MSTEGGSVLAVDLGGTGIKAEVIRRDGSVLAAERCDTPRGDGQAVLDAVVALGRDVLRRCPASTRPRLVGVAVPGLVDVVAGAGLFSANLGWRAAPVVRVVTAGLQLPVVMAHDVAAAGLAEHRLGAGRGCDDVVIVVVGTGVAACLVVGGRLVVGGLGQAGELGHVRVVPDGPVCGCGRRGCVESVASAAAIAGVTPSVPAGRRRAHWPCGTCWGRTRRPTRCGRRRWTLWPTVC